jgi:hypothetical protein
MPDLVQVGQAFAERGGQVVAVSQDLFVPRATVESVMPKVKKTILRLGMDFDVVIYDGELEALNDRFDLPGPIPTTIAIDGTGKIVDREENFADLERFREMMQRALGGG